MLFKWIVVYDDRDEPHVVPLVDLREHEISERCWCRPVDDEGIWVHNSMDRRELIEQGLARPH